MDRPSLRRASSTASAGTSPGPRRLDVVRPARHRHRMLPAGAEEETRDTPAPDEALGREGWLRAAVLGADDGIVSTASLIVGVAASDASPAAVLTAGLAGLVAGAASMA